MRFSGGPYASQYSRWFNVLRVQSRQNASSFDYLNCLRFRHEHILKTCRLHREERGQMPLPADKRTFPEHL